MKELSCFKGDFIDAMVKCGAIEFDATVKDSKPPFHFCYDKMKSGEGAHALQGAIFQTTMKAQEFTMLPGVGCPGWLKFDIVFGPSWLANAASKGLADHGWKAGYGFVYDDADTEDLNARDILVSMFNDRYSALVIEETTTPSRVIYEALRIMTRDHDVELIGKLAISDWPAQGSTNCDQYGNLPLRTLITVDEMVEYWCNPEVVRRRVATDDIHQLALEYRKLSANQA